jgi:nucleotide-binding universal stress UspA family protein
MSDALSVNTVLVPVDGSDESVRAVDYGVTIAARYGASVHVVYVVGEEVVRGIEAGRVSKEAVADEAEAFADRSLELAAEASVPANNSTAFGFSPTRKTRHPGSVILDTAEEIDADFIVVPRERAAGETGDVLEKAAEYVLLYASQPVLSV